MKNLYSIKCWSNIFFVIPLVFAAYHHVWWYVIIMGVVIIVSSAFHATNESKKLEYIDITSSVTLMASNFILLFQGYWSMPYSLIAVACAVIALVFYLKQFKGKYDLNHGLWHIFSAGVSFFCIASVVFT